MPWISSCLRGNSMKMGRFLLASAVGTFLFADISAAYAQIETVVVTARKRAENVQNVPVAVTALSGEKLEQYNITSIEKVAAQTPQLVVARGSSGSGADISLRGIGSSSENIGIEQSVAVNVDGVYLGQGRAINEGLFDLKQVEVLRGPQALYFGKNATAGVISLESADPTDQFEAMARVGYEFHAQNAYLEGYVSGPVTDTLGLRLAVRGSNMFGGYFTNEAVGGLSYTTFDAATGATNVHPTTAPSPRNLPLEKDGLVRLTAKWAPTDEFTMTLKLTGDVYKTANNVSNSVSVNCPLGHPQLDPAETCGKQWKLWANNIPADIAASDPLLSRKGGKPFEDYQSYTAILNAQYVTPKLTLSSVSGYQTLYNDWAGDQDFTGTPAVYAGEHFTWRQFSTEERVLTTFDFPVNFSGGLYYQSTRLNFNQDVLFASAQNSAVTDPSAEYVAYRKLSATNGTTYAAFGQIIVDILPTLQGTAGGRYTHEIKSSFFRQPYVNPLLTSIFVPDDSLTAPFPVITAHQSFDNFSPEFMLTWRPQENLTIYGGWKRGFKSGGFSNSAINSTLGIPSDLIFRPEKAQGVEGGVKSTWFDHQLQVNLDIYDYLYTDLQVDFFNTPTFNYTTLNAASARTKGIEFETQYAPDWIKGLLLRGTLAYNDAHYSNFIAPCSPAGMSYQQGCNLLRVVDNIATGAYHFTPDCGGTLAFPTGCNFFDASGRPTSLAPRWTASFEADYSTPIGMGLIMSMSGNLRYSSSYLTSGFPSDVNLAVARQSAYAAFDATLRVGDEANHWEVALIGKNLTNAFINVGTAGLPLSGAGTGLQAGSPGQIISDQGGIILDPRTVALQLTYRY